VKQKLACWLPVVVAVFACLVLVGCEGAATPTPRPTQEAEATALPATSTPTRRPSPGAYGYPLPDRKPHSPADRNGHAEAKR
jgi:hypothetical protein